MLSGVFVALVTPFREGRIDARAIGTLVESLLSAGVDGLVPCGTTGEASTLSDEEHLEVIRLVAARAKGRALVLAGTGSNDTEHAVRLTRGARERGADAALVVAPYYNKPTQEGLYRHFGRIASEGRLPVVVYNVPSRCGVEVAPETIVRLRREHSGVVAVKHACESIAGASRLLATSDIVVLSGDDSLTLPLMAVGAQGVVSVLANAWPGHVKAMVDAASAGDFATARRIHLRTFALACGLLSVAANPMPIKTVLADRGIVAEEFRLPLCPLSAEQRQRLTRLVDDFESGP